MLVEKIRKSNKILEMKANTLFGEDLELLKALNIQEFGGDGDGGDGGDDGGAGGGDDNGDQGDDKGQGNDGSGTGDDDGSDDNSKQKGKVYDQAEVNRIAAREAKKAQEKLLKQLGVKDFKTAKDGLEQYKQHLESQKTDAQKAVEKAQELEKNFNSISEENTNLKAQVATLKAGVKSEYVEDVVTLASKLISDDVDFDEAVKQVVTKYPHFKNIDSAGDDKEKKKKPKFSEGDHKKDDKMDEVSKWVQAFNFGGMLGNQEK